MIRVCVLGSGSRGNCIYLENDTDAVLIDAGLSAREIARRLQARSLDIQKVRAICITHEHVDHVRGLAMLHKQQKIPLFANRGTIEGIRDADARNLAWNIFANGQGFNVGAFSLLPFPLPHDAYDPVGFILSDGQIRIGIATDFGMPTHLIREHLRGCQMLVLEANHDETLLREANRPWVLKQRILGHQGHLSNTTAADLLTEIAGESLQHIFLAHLSQDCNRPELARQTVLDRLKMAGLSHIHLYLTHQDEPSPLVDCI